MFTALLRINSHRSKAWPSWIMTSVYQLQPCSCITLHTVDMECRMSNRLLLLDAMLHSHWQLTWYYVNIWVWLHFKPTATLGKYFCCLVSGCLNTKVYWLKYTIRSIAWEASCHYVKSSSIFNWLKRTNNIRNYTGVLRRQCFMLVQDGSIHAY